ncbi:MAG: NUDIX hydrolase [bacterium]
MYLFDGNLLKLKVEEGYELVEHPGASACLIVYQKQILLVKQYRKALNEHTWEIPAGKIDKSDKDPLTTILREVKEETGINLDSNNLIYLGKIYTTPGFSNEIIHLFFYEIKDQNIQQLSPQNPQEIDQIKFFPISQIFQMINENQIKDSKTLCAICMALTRNFI